MAYFLRTFFVYLVLFGATAFGVRWAMFQYYADSFPAIEGEVDAPAGILSMPAFRVQPRETESGLVLAGMIAQNRRDWNEAWKDFSTLNEKYADTPEFALRALTLALGNGEYRQAEKIAVNMNDVFMHSDAYDVSADKYDLERLFLTFIEIKDKDYANALVQARTLTDGPLAAFAMPIIENWLNAQTAPDKITSSVEGLNSLQVYYKAMAAEYAHKTDVALSLMKHLDLSMMPADKIENVAAFYVRQGKTDKAIDIVRRSLLRYVDSESLAVLLAILEKDHDVAQSIATLDVSLTPEAAIASAFQDFAIVMLSEGAVDSTLLFSRMAVYLNADTGGAFMTIADVLKYQDQKEKAIEAYSKITADDSDYERAVTEQVGLLGEMDDWSRAEEVIRDALTKQSAIGIEENPYFYFLLGNSLREQKRYDEALDAYNTAETKGRELNGDDLPLSLLPIYYVRAVVYDVMGQWDLAEKDLQTALEKLPNNPVILNYLGYAYADRDVNLDTAKDMISRAVMAAPNDPYIIDSMGWLFYRTGEYDAAVNFLERAAVLSPYHMVINDHLGDAYWQVGRKIEAYYMWRRAADYYDPSDEEQVRMIDETKRKIKEGL